MTKADLTQIAYDAHGALTKTETGAVIESILQVLKERLARGGRVLITNFGAFETTSRRTRRGRNPVTGEIVAIRPRRTVVFRPARKLSATID